jgi:hypothetical protein
MIAIVFLLAITSRAATPQNPQAPASTPSRKLLFSASLDMVTGKYVIEENTRVEPQSAGSQPPFVIERIDFLGNRRVRSDTLKARIFSREGDPYNEETLRRDFQALWNTQFFEDVKLRVEDSSKRPDGKIIIFDVKERPQIRRIRYDGIHSVSESDILDRFKERKVGLSVESQFDPTKIKKGRTRAAIREGDAAVRAHCLEQRGDTGFQSRGRAESQSRQDQIHGEPRVQRPQIDPRHAPRPAVRDSAVLLVHLRTHQDLRQRKIKRGSGSWGARIVS